MSGSSTASKGVGNSSKDAGEMEDSNQSLWPAAERRRVASTTLSVS